MVPALSAPAALGTRAHQPAAAAKPALSSPNCKLCFPEAGRSPSSSCFPSCEHLLSPMRFLLKCLFSLQFISVIPALQYVLTRFSLSYESWME